MSEPATTSSAPTFPRWLLSALGVAGSILIIMGVLAIAYYSSKPTQAVDAAAAATRAKNLEEVRSKQADLFASYSVSPSTADPKQKVIRIPVERAMAIMADENHLGGSTKGKPEAPAPLSLAASPAGFTPPAPLAPPTAAAPATAGAAVPAAGATAPATPPNR